MTHFSDSGHRPHARFTGEEPKNIITRGPESLRVTLDTWGPQDNLFPTLYDALQSNWGDAPSRTVDRPCPKAYDTKFCYTHAYGMCKLTDGELIYVNKCFAGQTLQQVLEGITFLFTIDGCSRATTHQIVRTRLGAGFMQHGGRDNDWRHRPWTMPETIARACDTYAEYDPANVMPAHAITDWDPIRKFLGVTHASSRNYVMPTLRRAIEMYLQEGRELYAALVDAGIPWQDARRLLWMGTQTYIHAEYNYLALKGVIGKRGEHIMDWEINCVSQLLLRQVHVHCPPVFAKYLGSLSDTLKKDAYAGLESWSPVGKYPNPNEVCKTCGHAKGNHTDDIFPAAAYTKDEEPQAGCEVCLRSSAVGVEKAMHPYVPHDPTERTHRPEQNPFWVLHPAHAAGGSLDGKLGWIVTNGTWPQTIPDEDKCDVYSKA